MKRMPWKTALFCGLALSLSSIGVPTRGSANAQGIAPVAALGDRGGKGDGKPAQAGGVVKTQVGGATRAVQPAQGGNAPGAARRGAIHAPAMARPPQSATRGGQPPQPIVRAPTFSRPNPGVKRAVTASPPVAAHPPVAVRAAPAARIGINPGANTPAGTGLSGAIRRGSQGLQGNVDVGAGPRRSGSIRSSIVNRPFDGNTVNFNNRNFNLGNNSYQPAYYRHSGYHGFWNGNRGRGSNFAYGGGYGQGWGWGLGNNYGYGGGYGGFGGGYGYRPFGWGLGGWGLGSLIYGSGYLGYSNPYYASGGWSGYNYMQPIPVSYYTSAAVVANGPNSADDVLNSAVAAFKQHDYDAALDITNKGIVQYPDDAVLHEFRSLVLFARSDYQQSAATIHAVLAVGPGWDWTTLSSMYPSVARYTEHLRALEAFTKSNPQDAASRFLLAYHYMSGGHPDAAARHLQQVVKLMPNDRVAADVLKMVSASQPIQPGETAQQQIAQPARAAAEPVDPATLVGAWKAARADGSKFNLTLTNDAKFSWTFSQKGQAAQEFGGTYSVEDNVLALERKDGGSLIAEVTPGAGTKFNFRLLGAPADDTGLDFSR